MKADGINPLALALSDQDVWTAAILFEAIFLATAGPEVYTGFWAGERQPDDPAYVDALRMFARVASYASDDAPTLSYMESLGRVADGTSAMTIQGSWCNGSLVSLGWEPGGTWQQTTSPGTSGIFVMAAGAMMVRHRASRSADLGTRRALRVQRRTHRSARRIRRVDGGGDGEGGDTGGAAAGDHHLR